MFDERLKKARKDRKMSQEALSRKLGTKQTTVSGWENAGNEPPYEMLLKIAEALNVSTDYLLGFSNNPQRITKTGVYLEEVTAHELDLLRAYRLMTPDQRGVIRAAMGVSRPEDSRAKPTA